MIRQVKTNSMNLFVPKTRKYGIHYKVKYKEDVALACVISLLQVRNIPNFTLSISRLAPIV